MAADADDDPWTEVLDAVARIARRALRARIAQVTVLDADRAVVVGCAPRAPLQPEPVAFDAAVVAAGRLVAITDALTSTSTREDPVVGRGLRAYAGVPLLGTAGAVLGTLSVLDVGPRAWSAAELARLTELSGLAAAAVLRPERQAA